MIRNINQTWKYPEMQILYFWGLTSSEETKGHTAEEPDGHDREGQMGRSLA